MAPNTESSESMSETQGKQRSAVVFGARNLGRAVIELLVSDGWAVAGVARSQSTLDGVSAAGALALKADVTTPRACIECWSRRPLRTVELSLC